MANQLRGMPFAFLLTAALAVAAPALAEQKRPLVMVDDNVAPLPPGDTLGTRPNAPIDVANYMTAEQVADVIAGTKTLDVTQAVQNWLAACVAEHRACRAMPGLYRISGPIVFEQAGNLTTGLTVYSESPGQTIFDSSYTDGLPFLLQASGGTPAEPVSATYAYLSGLSFRCNYAGPCVTIGRPDYADQINEFTLWRLSVQNANATAGSTAYEFNAVFSGYVYANGSTGASPGRIATLGKITGGSGYVDGTYVDVPLTGSVQGSLAKAEVTVTRGAVTSVKITSGGVIYNVGDVVTIPAASVGGRGTGFSAPVTAVINVPNDIYRIKQSAFTSYKIGGSSGWNFVHLTDTYSYGNTFISPDCEIVATCYKIDSFNAVRNTSLGGTYAYSNYGHGVDASTGSFVAINPNINADASRFMAPGSTAFAARWTNDTVALTNAPTFSSSVTTRNPSGAATLALTSAAHTTNLNADPGGNFFLSNTKQGGFTVLDQAGPGVLQFKVNGTQVAAMFDSATIFDTRTTAPAIGTSGYTVATLPASPANGDRAYVTDARACTFMAILAGGGATLCPVIYLDGWKAGG